MKFCRTMGLRTGVAAVWLTVLTIAQAEGPVDYNTHILPILSDRCFPCHGPDAAARKAGLRLDRKDGAFGTLEETDGFAFVPGDLERSVAWLRMVTEDADDLMPPPDSKLTLSPLEKERIRRWLEGGAQWNEHWAFIPPVKPSVPFKQANAILSDGQTVAHPVDAFILSQLSEHGLRPSPEASKTYLLRRLSFDLTGLPPSPEELDAFLADDSPMAYEREVDRLLNSETHAERMAMEWLDVARYADTQGMHGDTQRYHWPWRDWVIDAFRNNMPYDDFITWQLAGDLLPDATREQILATAFNRNHPVSAEGGIIDEEFRVKYVQDRVNTVGTAFLGLTLECASCHEHKFDPISQKEYYQLFAFFNNQRELGMVAEGGTSSGPVLLLPEPRVKNNVDKLLNELEQARGQLESIRKEALTDATMLEKAKAIPVDVPIPDAEFPFDAIRPEKIPVKGTIHRVVRNTPIDKMVDDNPKSVASGEPELVDGPMGNALRFDKEYDLVFLREDGTFEVNEPFSAGAWIRSEKDGENQSIMGISGELGSAWKGWDFFLDGESRLSLRLTGYWPQNYLQVTTLATLPKNEWHHVMFAYDGLGNANGVRLFINGENVACSIGYDNLYHSIVHGWGKQEGWPQKPVIVGRSGRFYTGDNGVFLGSIDHVTLFKQYVTEREIAALYASLTGSTPDESNKPPTYFIDHFLQRESVAMREASDSIQSMVGRKLELLKDVPEIMVLGEMERIRKTYVLNRGQYDSPTEEVQPGVPSQILSLNTDALPNRLDLAQWLTDPQHPLTARVTVNRYWQMLFGRGIVDTPQDFGTQGAPPTHPELLDWLAVSFIESGWDVRWLIRTMVTSATYRQSTVSTPEHVETDTANIYLARGPYHRLPAEMIRDNALAASGLLTHKVGGPSVKPYQPAGLWVEKTGPGSAYKPDKGANLYRRSMYTYVRRTTPHPAMIAFDAPNRSVCTVKREKTNTPLQSLVLLNDPEFLESARVLAQRLQKETSNGLVDWLRQGFRLLCGRHPDGSETELLTSLYELALKKYTKDPESTESFLSVGEYPLDPTLNKAQTAALTQVMSTIMNFDEAYMKR
ncbi:MAG: DUF1553 domain-containing protein [Verrucomicrobiota bacterium]